MGFRVLPPSQQEWRSTNVLGVPNADLGRQLGARDVAVRLWRLAPGQAIPRHRHRHTTELYVVLEGTGRMRVDGELVTLERMGAAVVEPGSLRQVFNDTDAECLWLVAGAPPEYFPITEEAHAAERRHLYPDGVDALPPELAGPAGEDGAR
jgi:quercetin dioxygenase-like cupin family protein